MNIRTFLPFDTDDLAVRVMLDGEIVLVIGRALVNLKPSEADALADSLRRAAIVSGSANSAALLPFMPPIPAAPPVTEAMVDRAVGAWEAWWTDYARSAGTTSAGANRSCLAHVLREVLGGAA